MVAIAAGSSAVATDPGGARRKRVQVRLQGTGGEGNSRDTLPSSQTATFPSGSGLFCWLHTHTHKQLTKLTTDGSCRGCRAVSPR